MRKTNRSTLTWLSVGTLAVSCYHLDNAATIMTGAPAWTGAGHASVGNSNSGRAMALAGEDIYVSSAGMLLYADSPLLPELGAGYTLTGIAQTHTLGHHENTFLHAYPSGDVGFLDLFLVPSFHFNSYTRITATSPWFIEGGTVYELTRICDMAAVPLPTFGSPADPDSHLFLSVQACEMATGTNCIGGVVEADFSATEDEWGVKNASGWQAAVRKPHGARFNAECMPISATGLGDTNTHYIAVGDPSHDELSLFEVGALDEPAVSSKFISRPTQNIRDLVLEGRGDGATDFSFLAVLWSGSGGTTLEHWLATNGAFGASAFLTEVVPSSTRFIHTTGIGGKPASGYADIYTFGSTVVRRTYQQN